MKATLEFDLPEDSAEHRLAINAGRMHSALWDARAHIRLLLKYGDQHPTIPWAEDLLTIINAGLDDE